MTEYLINTSHGMTEFHENGEKKSSLSAMLYLKRQCALKLFSYESYMKQVKLAFNIKKNVPVYIHHNELFLSIGNKKHHETIFINFFAILAIIKIREGGLKIIFKSGRKLIVSHNFKKIENMIRISERIAQYRDR